MIIADNFSQVVHLTDSSTLLAERSKCVEVSGG
jgi:hypothetical protein